MQVNVIIRPLLEFELNNLKNLTVCNKRICINTGKEYVFDTIYDNESRKEIFEKSIKHNLDKCFDGFNFSAIAYGQTVLLN
jgi:hypothetical protein